MKNSIFQTILKLSGIFSVLMFFQIGVFAAGVVDRSFGTNGSVSTNLSHGSQSIVFQPDGKFIVGGYFGNSGAITRFNENGSLDTTFGSGGTATVSGQNIIINDVLLQSDGKIVIAGGVFPNPQNGTRDFLLARFTAQGTPDAGFGSGGFISFNQGSFDTSIAAAIQPDGKIVAAGNTSDGGNRGAVLRFNANGTLDMTFADQGLFFFSFTQTDTVSSSGYQDIKVLPNGRILLGATYARTPPVAANNYRAHFLTMLDSAGRIDTNFGAQGFAGFERSICCGNGPMNFEVLPNGRIFVASYAGITVFNQNGSLYKLLPFEGGQTSMLPDGRVLVSGDNSVFDAQVASVKLYSGESFIGKYSAFRYASAFAAPNGKILVAAQDENFRLLFNRLNLITSQGTRVADFNRDDKTDFGVYQPSGALSTLRVLNSGNSSFNVTVQGTRIIPEFSEYFDADRRLQRDSIISWRRGVANVPFNSSYYETSRTGSHIFEAIWGVEEDIPTGGDFNGDAKTDMTVFRPSEGVWYSMRSDNGTYSIARWGASGDKPVPADYDYDGKTDYAVYRPSTGTWWIYRSSDGGSFAVKFGIATDIPLTGDFDADGKADFTVYRPSEGNWYQLLTTEGFRVVRFGLAADIPVPGDYDGDGRHDVAVFRNGQWYLLQSLEGLKIVQFGQTNDLPAAVRYDQ